MPFQFIKFISRESQSISSSFSRAVEMDFDTCKRVMVSGTASIDPVGNTVYFGDIDKQVGLTMQVIEEILLPKGFGPPMPVLAGSSLSNTLRSVKNFVRPLLKASYHANMS